MALPVIGLTLDSEAPGGYSKFPWYAMRENYCSTVAALGGLPVALPHEPERVEAYLDRLDGLIVTGGNFDVDPALFGADSRHATVTTKDKRTGFEVAITKGAIERDMPVLGICGGQQLLHVVLGGTLIQHIPDSVENALAHEQPNPRDEPGHVVKIVEGTLLHRITGLAEMAVNSAHHQAADARARRHRGRRARARRRHRGHRGSEAALLPRRAMAPGVPDRPRRPPHLRGVPRRVREEVREPQRHREGDSALRAPSFCRCP